ncbi:sensor histidine kinase [Salinadaptatus halalkaliphilus]|nr:HAMP domain-containing sensor histidine kinase [Salinadaptatus halalkaliphilus]
MSSESTDTVQLFVGDDANSDALEALLSEYYAVTTETEALVGDIVLVDDRSFSTYRERFEAHIDQNGPTFVPVVLVCRSGTTIDESLLTATSDGRPLVDDIVEAPVREHVLARRLSNLLAHRRQFEQLTAQNERLEEFASVVSHDLRNPLQVAKGRTELLQETVADSDREHLREIEESLDRMDDIIDNVLTLAREGTVADDVEMVALGPVVDEAWSVVDAPAATLRVTDSAATIRADREQLRTVFENLLRNSVEHTGEDPTIEVGATTDGFYVADNGPGIPTDERDDVLERGYSTAEDGTGLGLDIVANIVEAHDWEITVGESETGGARFEITGVSRPSNDR